MTNAIEQQKVFWEMFDQELDNQGNPFQIRYRKHYGTINKRTADSDFCLGLDFLYRNEAVRVGIYMLDNVPAFDFLYSNKEKVEDELGFRLSWTMSGVKKPNLRRVEILTPIIANDEESYLEAIRLTIVRAKRFINVIPKYLEDSLFDF